MHTYSDEIRFFSVFITVTAHFKFEIMESVYINILLITQVLKPIHFGGDQLTEERAINVQIAMDNGETVYKRIGGLMPKSEDWHLKKTFYEVFI